MNPVLRRLRFRRFSTVQLLITLGVFFSAAPFVEEIEGSELSVSGLFSLVLLAGVVAVADRDGLLARGPIDACRSLLFQHELRAAIHERVHWLLFQLHHTEHGWLRRHHSCFKNRALARRYGSDDRATLRGGPDCPSGFTLFDSEIKWLLSSYC